MESKIDPNREVKLHYTHRNRIKKLFQERYSLVELYLMYNERIPYKQLRELVRGIKRNEKI